MTEEVASYENRLSGIETKLVALAGNVTLLAWMVSFNLILTLAIGGLLLKVAGKVGALGWSER